MKSSYSPEEVAAAHLPAEWKDRVRWLKRRIASGEIPGKRISRGVYRMTDEDIETWLTDRDDSVQEQREREGDAAEVVSVLAGLSRR